MKRFLFFILISTLVSCVKIINWGHKSITIVNKSSEKVIIAGDLRDFLLCPVYMDTVRNYNCLYPNDSSSFGVPAYENSNWELRLNDTSRKWYVTFFKLDIYLNNPCDTLNKYKLYEKQVQISLDSMIKNNWTVSYP
jgi:hypothetical protein